MKELYKKASQCYQSIRKEGKNGGSLQGWPGGILHGIYHCIMTPHKQGDCLSC